MATATKVAKVAAKTGKLAKLIQLSKWSQSKLKIFAKYAIVELTPPKPSEIPQLVVEVKELIHKGQTKAWRNVSVLEATINVAICIEIACWWCLGEIIGKRHIIGYDVPGCAYLGANVVIPVKDEVLHATVGYPEPGAKKH